MPTQRLLSGLCVLLLLMTGALRADDPSPVVVGDIVEVILEDVPVKLGERTIETVDVCERFQVLAVEGESVRVRARGKEGLLSFTSIRVVPEFDVGDLVEVIAETTPVRWEKEIRATVKKGDELIVLKALEQWVRVQVDGKEGWVARRDVREVTMSIPAQRTERGQRLLDMRAATRNDNTSAYWANLKRIIAIDRAYLHPVGGDRRDVDRENRARILEELPTLTRYIPNYLYGDRDEPMYVVDASLLALSMQKELHGKSHWRTVSARIDFDRAVKRWQMTAEQRGRLDDSDILTNRAVGKYESGKKDEAFSDLKTALEIRRELLPDSLDVSTTLNEYAVLLGRSGKHEESLPVHELALEIRRRVVGEEHPDSAHCLHNLGFALHELGRYEEAGTRFERAAEIRSKVVGEETAVHAVSLYWLAKTHVARRNLDRGRDLYFRVLEIRGKVLGEQHHEYANALTNLGLVYVEMGEYTRARPHLERALDVYRVSVGEEHLDNAAGLNNLGYLNIKQGDFAAALPQFVRACRIINDKLGMETVGYVSSLNNAAHCCMRLGHDDEALELYERNVELRRKVFGEEHSNFAIGLNNLANIHVRMGNHAAAEPLFEQSRAIYAKLLGEEHPDYAVALHNLANLKALRGDFAEARRVYERALEISSASLGVDHPEVLRTTDQLAHLRAASGDWADSAMLFERERRGVRRHAVRVLRGLSPTKQLRFLVSEDVGPFHGGLTLALERRDDADIARMSAGWLLNGKAVAVESLGRSLVSGRESSDPRIVALVEELRSARDRLARESLRTAEGEVAESRSTRLAELQENVDRLIRRVGELGAEVAEEDPWVELEDVRRNVRERSVLIEVARFNVANFQVVYGEGRWKGSRYAAWIVPREGAVKVVDLGEAEPIDAAVTAARTAIEKSPAVVRDQGEEAAESAVLEPLRALSSMILEPLLAQIGDDVDRLIIGPDGALCLVPWAALPLADGRYAVERYEVGYVVSGRDLVTRSEYRGEVTAPLILADPDFERAPADVRTADTAELRGAEGTYGTLPRVKRLPATAAEARAIQPGMTALAGAEPVTYLGAAATEEVFKRTAHPAVLSLSTHGFFLKDREEKTSDGESPDAAGAVAFEDPLLRCGLFLAGSNQRHRAADGLDDGILTGSEIVGTDLRGTKLVVLSACETGVGKVQDGEGVAGLRQAFQLAGAESVVSSLWHVDDLATARLMQGFFKNLAEPNTRRTAALRQSQLDRIASRRDRYGAAHPFYWAAFTLTGKAE